MGRDGGAPICPQGRQARVKGIMDGTATRTSLPGSSGTPPHVGCSPLARVAPRASGHWPQGGHTLLHCLGESSLPPQHKKSSFNFLFRVFLQDSFCRGSCWRGAAQRPHLPPTGRPAPSDQTGSLRRETASICLAFGQTNRREPN